MKSTTPQPTYTLPPITGRIVPSQVPCSDYVTITLLNGEKVRAIAIMNEDGTFDCWRMANYEIYWGDEVKGWEV